MPLILVILFVILVFYAPQWWVRHVFHRYSKKLDRIPGSGGELARHLLDKFDMHHVKVEITDKGDHYDPATKTVRLSPANFNDNSLPAIAAAAHEVGHAIQDQRNEKMLRLRTQLLAISNRIQQLGSIAFWLLPVIGGITRSPLLMLLMMILIILTMASAVVVHLVTLPVEIDASYNKALPILKQGYIDKKDIAAVRKILRAAAWTYVAASMASVFNLWRWLAILLKR